MQTNAPREPQSIPQTGLTLTFITDLAIKTLYFRGEMSARELCDEMKLPFVNVMEEALGTIKREALTSITGGSGINEQTFRYVLTSEGARRAQEAMQRSQYVGPAPVKIADYCRVVGEHTVGGLRVTAPQVALAFGRLVLPQAVLDQLGPAINSGRSVFVYGAPGGGKSLIAAVIASMLGGEVYVPYAVDVGGDVVQVYDPQIHEEAGVTSEPAWTGMGPSRPDARWLCCRRPHIVAGGELTLAALDLVYDPFAKYYEAPLQMKANGGMLLLDDFGRQLVRPADLLNRWLVPLEKRLDYLTLHNGKKVQIPFDVLLVFSTNLDPAELVDEAFLRRIRHKVLIPAPSPTEFAEIMRRVCNEWRVPFRQEGYEYLLRVHYEAVGRELRGVHPRDLIQQIVDIARYRDVTPEMTVELVDAACASYFVKL